jgi:glucosamine--fructose-6-phosphate aminotransferase (isomerizing)
MLTYRYKKVKRLEYRGYDSAGVMIYDESIKLSKTKGKVADLEEKASKEISTNGTIGIGVIHVMRHMVFPNDVNSHLIFHSGDLVIIHNGIIENYAL